MGNKNQQPIVFNWQAISPVIGFLPNPFPYGSAPSMVIPGDMTGTSTIYTNIIDQSRMDNIGLEVAWTGTPTGMFKVMASNSGINFFALTFIPALGQPAGSAGGYLVDMSGFPFKYIMLQYTNVSGAGSISVYGQSKDTN